MQEITQVILTRALVASAGRPSALETYQGRGALAHFIGIAAQRLALDDRRAARNERKLLDRLADEPATPVRGPEQSLLRERYRASSLGAATLALRIDSSIRGRLAPPIRCHAGQGPRWRLASVPARWFLACGGKRNSIRGSYG